MAREIVWTESAWKDLEAVADYIARDSEHYAAAIVLETRDAARSLAEMADRGRNVPEFEDRNVRELLLGNYRLIYRVLPKVLQVLAFIHGARALKKSGKPKKRAKR